MRRSAVNDRLGIEPKGEERTVGPIGEGLPTIRELTGANSLTAAAFLSGQRAPGKKECVMACGLSIRRR